MGRGRNVIARFCAISALALCAGSFIEEARSEQFFVCDGGKAMRIADDQLEIAKRTNPCVARHYGLKIEDKASKAARKVFRPVIRPPERTTTTTDIELPVRKPKLATVLKTLPSPQTKENRSATNLHAKTSVTDFRKVRIINAAPKSAKWFNHDR